MSKTALISVSNKEGIIEFATTLQAAGVRLLSTGGTASALRDAGLSVVDVSEHTGFPEMMAGRVKTLHPKIHGGLLGRRAIDADVMQEHGIDAIDLLVVNLYPFAQTIARPDCTLEEAIENIDIGGPAMIRSAAKNHQAVTVVTDPADYTRVAQLWDADAELSLPLRQELATKAFAHTAAYDAKIAAYLADAVTGGSVDEPDFPPFPQSLELSFEKKQEMRYGENPHQQAAFYAAREPVPSSIADSKLMQGKELSYNNIADADAALACAKEFSADEKPGHTCVIVKHANPCGVASAASAADAYQLAFACDPTSAFGGIIAFNTAVDEQLAETILQQQFVEVLLAPQFTPAALEKFVAKPALRVMQVSAPFISDSGFRYTSVSGGLLVQSVDSLLMQENGLECVSENKPTDTQLGDLMFAWRVAKYVKSNAIVFAKNLQTVGIGAGQMSRVYSARIAAIKAADEGLLISGSVLASDAFFPFRDGIDSAAEAGVSAIIQPGGSRNDAEVINAANEHGIAMVFSGMRHFRH